MDKMKKNVLFTREASVWLKWAAIVMVIASHYAEWWSWFTVEEGTREVIRFGLSRMGPYGVAIFLLFSGYGLAKSAGNNRIGLKFILKRVLSVYVPYLIMIILIEFLAGNLHSLADLSGIWYGQNFWYMTVMFSLYIGFMAIWLLIKNRHIRAVLMAGFTYLYSNHLYHAGEYDFWYISNIAFVIGVLFALYEAEVLKLNTILRGVLMLVFAIGSAYVVYSGLYIEHIWAQPLDEIKSRIYAVTIFTFFISFLASVWCYYDPIGRFLGKYSLYFYLSHTFLFMWAINHYEYEIGIRFLIATLIIIVVSVVLGMIINKLTDFFYQKVQSIVDFRPQKG